jgi:hypothetical protein
MREGVMCPSLPSFQKPRNNGDVMKMQDAVARSGAANWSAAATPFVSSL